MKREIALPKPTINPIMIPGTMENQQYMSQVTAAMQQVQMNGYNPALSQVQPFQQNYSQPQPFINTYQPPKASKW